MSSGENQPSGEGKKLNLLGWLREYGKSVGEEVSLGQVAEFRDALKEASEKYKLTPEQVLKAILGKSIDK